jgi:hypothetical protein
MVIHGDREGRTVNDDIMRQIERTYTSLDDPRFFTISEALDNEPFAQLMKTIGTQFTVEDDTDTNTDVAFIYGLEHDGRRWVLGLSVVGPYALLGRLDANNRWTALIEATTRDQDEYERWLVLALNRQGLRLLGRSALEQRVPLRLSGMNPAHVRAYQALFAQSDILPWDDETLGRLGLI